MKAMKTFVCLLFLLTICAPAVAEPVTLAFEAEIIEVNSDPIPLTLPFHVEVGETLRGTFTFEPLDVDSSVERTETNQPFIADFEIDAFSFSSADYLAQSFDDVLSDEDNSGGLSPPSGPEDVIRLKRTLGGDLGDPSMLQWGFAFAFFGDENVLDGADLPADIAPWQAFSEGSLRLTFANQDRNNSDSVLASILSVHAIPEPATAVSLATLLASLVLFRYTQRDRR